jgi:RecB family exonuclease
VVLLSKSSLNTFLVCPRLYKFLYIDKVPTQTTEAAQRGSDVHDFCNLFYDHLTFSGKNFSVDKKWLDEQLSLSTDEAKPFIENFIEFEKLRWKSCVDFSPENPEKYFLPVLREEKITNRGLEMVGIIDRVDLNFDGKSYTVVDYKTERFDQRPWKLTEHRREMCFYRKLLENSGLLKGPVTHFCIYYPRSNDVWNESFSWQTTKALEKSLREVREDIEAERFPCQVSLFCRWCSVNNICPME